MGFTLALRLILEYIYKNSIRTDRHKNRDKKINTIFNET